MATSLLIVESPAKCSKIQGFLGSGWRVIATMGHIRALEEDLDAVGLKRDFEPRFAFLKEKGKAIAGLKDAAAKADRVYLASDDDREGEAISYSVALLLKLDPATTPRAVFHEITEGAVKAAVANPRRIDMNRVWAQQARAVLDMMVGFTVSPLLWKYVGQGLSAGRCQTPALRLLCDREVEIRDFQAETAWRVGGDWKNETTTFPATMIEDLEDEESALNFLENIHADSGGTVTEAITKPTLESPPLPLITSTLQQEVSAVMGIQPKNTMRIAQRLYEAGHITYMRTDSAVLSEEAIQTARAWVESSFGEEYLGSGAQEPAEGGAKKAKKGKTSKKAEKDGDSASPPAAQEAHESREKSRSTPSPPSAQEAHEAIRPTHFELTDLPADEDWNTSDRKVYKLIWQRAVQSVMAPARGEQRTVTFKADGDPGEFEWRAVWRRQLFAGWRRIGAAATDLDAAPAEEGEATPAATAAKAWTAATQIVAGSKLQWRSLEAAPHTSKAAARYTEATLVRELEKRGIGRPSTFAQLVGTILDKGYAEKRDTPAKTVEIPKHTLSSLGQWPPALSKEARKVGAEKQKLAPTPLGLSVIEFLERELSTLFAYEFTAQMEARLDGIAKGCEPWKALCRDTWASYSEKYEALQKSGSQAAGSARERLFANGIKAVQSKKGPLLLKEVPGNKDATEFYGWPPGGPAFGDITEADVTAFIAGRRVELQGEVIGEHEGTPMIKKKGPFGFYVECGAVKVPWTPEDTEEGLVEKLEAKGSGPTAALHVLGPFEFRQGPYGVYFFKKDLVGKGRKFVGLASGVDPKMLTLEAATKLFHDGLQAKARGAAFAKGRGGDGAVSRGGSAARGRGRGRGRGHA